MFNISISLIACVDENLGLGHENKLLTHLPKDLAHFKRLTKGNICIQGRNTYESIMAYNNKPLPNRTNMLLTTQENYKAHPSVFVYNSMSDIQHEYYSYCDKDTEVFVIGGGELYRQFLPIADYIYLTVIHHKFENVDTHFPQFLQDSRWMLQWEQRHMKDDKHRYDYSFRKYSLKH